VSSVCVLSIQFQSNSHTTYTAAYPEAAFAQPAQQPPPPQPLPQLLPQPQPQPQPPQPLPQVVEVGLHGPSSSGKTLIVG